MARVRRDANAGEHGLLEFSSEGVYDTRNLLRDALKRPNDWKALDGLASVAEEYARGDLDVHLHLRFKKFPSGEIKHVDSTATRAGLIRRYVFDPADLCIRAQRHPGLEVGSSRKPAELKCRWGSYEHRDEAVFVGIVQLLKAEKGAAPTPISTLVRLKRLDALPEAPGNTLDASRAIRLAPEVRQQVTLPSPGRRAPQVNGERRLVVRLDSPLQSKLPSQAVKGCPQVVGDLSNQQRPVNWEFLWPARDTEAVVLGLRVVLGYADLVEILPEELLKPLPQSHDLATRPVDSS